MAQNYKQRIHEGIWAVLDAHSHARVSDALAAMDAVIDEIWHQLPADPEFRRAAPRRIDKRGRAYMKDAVTKRYRLA